MYLRGWGDYQRYSLKLTESTLPGLGHMAFRAWSPQALERRVDAIERSRPRAAAGSTATSATGPRTGSPTPTGTAMELYYETERYGPPEHLRPALKNVPQRYVGRGAAVKRLDHVNVLAARRCRQPRASPRTSSASASTSRSWTTTAREHGAWMSLTIAAHELIYVADHAGASGRLHHLAFFVDTREEVLRAADLFLDADVPIEAAPSKHAVAQGMFLYVYEPGGNRVEVDDRHALHLRPRLRAGGLDPGRARPRSGLGREDDRDVPHLRHARHQRRRDRAADPADEPDPGRRRRSDVST